MRHFDDWLLWGRQLRDDDFARAWMVLGIVGAQPSLRPSLEENLYAAPGEPDLAASAIATSVQAIIASRDIGGVVEWRFPSRDAFASALDAAPPPAWSAAWLKVAATQGTEQGHVRVRAIDISSDESLSAWYSPLVEAAPAPGAVSIWVDPPNPHLFVDWPLRLATLPDNPAGAILAVAAGLGATRRLGRVLTLGRDVSNCDVLVLTGRADALLGALESAPGRVKTDLVVLLGAGPDAVESHALSSDLMRATHASGVLVVSEIGDPKKLAGALDECISQLSHNHPFDVALCTAFRRHGYIPIVRLSDDLANVRLATIAEQIRNRLTQLPPGARIDLSKVGETNLWRVRRTAGGGTLERAEADGIDLEHVRAEDVEFDVARLPYDREIRGGAEVAAVAEAVDCAEEPRAAEESRARRFLQQRSFVGQDGALEPAAGGYLLGRNAVVRVRIGREDPSWNAAPQPIREDLLPQGHREWRLTVWLTEPNQLERPLRAGITLPRDGNSTAADLTFTPKAAGDFEGRVTVLHRGRVLQTAVLAAKVRAPGDPAAAEGTPRLALPVAVRQHVGDLDARREFDAAFVLNHDGAGQPRAVAVSRDAAGVRDLTAALNIGANINTALGAVANSVEDFKEGLAGRNGLDLLVRLARHGERLRIALLNNLTPPGLAAKIRTAEYIQIVTTRPDTIVPFEFIYEYAAPENDAALCPNWKQSLETGSCDGACDTTNGRTVCPNGFWGLRKVLERHAAVPETLRDPGDAFLQSEPRRQTTELRLGNVALVAVSRNVKDPMPQQLVEAVTACLGAPALTATSWTLWRQAVEDRKPRLILALTHTDGGANESTLEIGGDTLETILLRRQHVWPKEGDGQPLVALLGCDTAGTAAAYGEPIAVFRDRGAAVVVGTIATVFGGHAVRVAELLVKALLPRDGAPPERLGEAIRGVRRRGLLDNLVMSLCVVAYGDADWRLTH